MGSAARIVVAVLAVATVASAVPAIAQDEFVAGVKPDERPAGAPRLGWQVHPRPWFEKALTGISQPYPASLWFLDAQGDWYTPFVVPGMPGRYDIRGWHTAEMRRP